MAKWNSPLVAVAQGELHDARLSQRRRELSERHTVCEEEITAAAIAGRLQGAYVEARRVGEIESLPSELELLGFGYLPGLANPQINSEIAGAP